jgi:hypothetical protein
MGSPGPLYPLVAGSGYEGSCGCINLNECTHVNAYTNCDDDYKCVDATPSPVNTGWTAIMAQESTGYSCVYCGANAERSNFQRYGAHSCVCKTGYL